MKKSEDIKLLKERRQELYQTYLKLIYGKLYSWMPEYKEARKEVTTAEGSMKDPAMLGFPGSNGTGVSVAVEGTWIMRATSILGNIQGLNFALHLLEGKFDKE